MIPPTAPGLGVELDEEVAARHPYDGRRAAPDAASVPVSRWPDATRSGPGTPARADRCRRASSSSFTTIGDQASPPYASRARTNVCSTSVASSSGTPSSSPRSCGEAEVLAGEVEREADVVAPVEDHLALGLVDEAVAGARPDHLERLRQVEPAALCQHQRLAGGDEMDEREHVRDHLDHRRAAERADVEDPAADRLEHRQVRGEDLGIAADDDGDLPGRREVNAAGDRRLEAARSPARRRAPRAARARGGRSCSSRSTCRLRASPSSSPLAPGEHVGDRPRRRQAGEDRVRGARDRARESPPRSRRRQRAASPRRRRGRARSTGSPRRGGSPPAAGRGSRAR